MCDNKQIVIEGPDQILYQWDTGQRLRLHGYEPGTRVDFARCNQNKAASVYAYAEGGEVFCDIPDAILMEPNHIRGFVYVIDGGRGETVRNFLLPVIPRPKPEDYVEPEEVPTWHELEQRIKKIEDEGVPDEKIERAVEDYLEENPIEAPKPDLTGVVKSVNGKTPDENGNVEITIPDSSQNGDGLTGEEKSLILSLFKATAYTADMSATIAKLESLWGGTGGEEPDIPDEPDEPDVPTYKVTNNLTGVTNSNTATTASGYYSATLTVNEGFVLKNLTVTMGGVDVTDDVYGDGGILITEVSGDIVITAVAEEVKQITSFPDYADTIKMYSDNGVTLAATKYYHHGAATLNATESDCKVTAKLINTTDAEKSCRVFMASCPGVFGEFHYVSDEKVAHVPANGSVEYEYTVKAGYKFAIAGTPKESDGIRIEVFGAFDVYQPVAEFATKLSYADNIKVYSGGTTDNLLKSSNYQNVIYTTEVFDEDTELTITLVGGNADVMFAAGEWYFGAADPTAYNAIYHGVKKSTGNTTTLKAGQVWKFTHTVPAGYAFAMGAVANNTLTAAMVYVEKAGIPDEPAEPDMPTYTVTNNLTNVVNSNTQTTITEGFYSATLATVDGYSMQSVVITMGGVDITADVYGDGGILITAVTGDIVITAVAGSVLAYALPEPLTFPGTGNAEYDTGYAMYPNGTKDVSACIDFDHTKSPWSAITLATANVDHGYKLHHTGNQKWRVSSNAGDATTELTLPLTNCRIVYTQGKNSGFAIYALVNDAVTKITGSTYAYYPESSENTVILGSTNANFVGAIHDFRVYDQILSDGQIEAYLRGGAI